MFRRNRACPLDGPAAGEDQGEADTGAGQGVPQGRDHDPGRRGRKPLRHPSRRDTVPAAGQHRAVSARRPLRRAMEQLMKTPYQRQARRKRGLGNWRMIRFADDFVVMVHGERRHAEALREEVTGVLATLGLRLAPEKTRVVHIDEGFDFLSITIRRMRKRGTSKHYVYTKPSKKAI